MPAQLMSATSASLPCATGEEANSRSGQAAAMNGETERKFHHAVHTGDINTVRSMISADPALASSTDEYKFQPVHLLDVYFEEEILDPLLANGADINARNEEGVTLLHIITDPDAIALLVGKGADLEAGIRGVGPLSSCRPPINRTEHQSTERNRRCCCASGEWGKP